MKKNIFLFILIAFTACNRSYVKTTANRYSITNQENFKLRKTAFTANPSGILIDKFYELTCYDGARWLKFYPDNKVSSGLEIIQPDTHHRDTLSLAGYYKLEGNELTMEITDGGKFKSDWSVLIVKAKVFGDTLRFYKDQWKGYGKNVGHFTNIRNLNGEECYYTKSNKPFNFRKPDW